MPTRNCSIWVALGLVTFVVVASLAPAALPPPSEWKIPPLDGELTGEFDPVLLGGAPRLKWKLTLRTEKPLERSVAFAIDGYGFRVRGDARVDPMGEGTWRIEEAEVNLGEWLGWLAPHVAPKHSAVSVAGFLHLTGAGTWRGGVLGGRAVMRLRDGRVEDPVRKVLFEGLAFDCVLEDIAGLRTAPAQVVTWQSGRYDVVPLGPGRIEFALDGETVTIARAVISVFGGELAVYDVQFSTERPEFSVSAQMTGVDMGRLLVLVPGILSHATGRLDGYVDLSRDSRGIAIGAGYLGLREGETALLRFASNPGMISPSLPPVINKAYAGLGKMETGQIPTRADVLQLRFMPQRDEEGRTAWIHIEGQPADPNYTGPFNLTVNVRGPLDEVLNFGATSALRLMGGR